MPGSHLITLGPPAGGAGRGTRGPASLLPVVVAPQGELHGDKGHRKLPLTLGS